MKAVSNTSFLEQVSETQKIAFNHSEHFLWAPVKSEVIHHIHFVDAQKHESWILFHEEPIEFLIRLLALLVCNKKILLPANKQPETLKQIDLLCGQKAQLYPEQLTSENIEPSTTNNIPVSLALPLDAELTLFTSGSSEKPKPVTKALQNLLNEIEQLESLWGTSFETVVATVSHQHLYGLLFRLLWPFFTGKPFSNYQIKYPEQLLELESKTALVTSPAILSRLDENMPYTQFSEVFSSGGPLAFADAELVEGLLKVRPMEVYGSTETGGIGYRRQFNVTTPWQLLPEVEIVQKQQDCSTVQSPFIFETRLQLDDRIELKGNRQFQLLGRKDRIIKLEEKRVSLEQMELYLQNTVWVSSVKCLLLSNKRMTLAAVIVLSPEGQEELMKLGKNGLVKMLKAKLLELFELVVIPKKWRFIDTMPSNSMNKVMTSELKELFK